MNLKSKTTGKIFAGLFVMTLLHGCSKNNEVAPTVASKIKLKQTNGPFGGSINALIVNGSNLIAGTGSGIFISADNGGHWNKSNLSRRIESLASNGAAIFAGTSDHGIYI